MKKLVALSFLLVLSGCFGNGAGPETVDIEETGQQVGDAMASIDEVGGSTGGIALQNSNPSFDEMRSARKTFARRSPADLRDAWYENLLVPTANATLCSNASTFSACSAHTMIRTFGNCTVGKATFHGVVGFDWTHAAPSATCDLAVAGDYVTRTPNFTVTGRRHATLSVTALTAAAERLTVVGGAGTSRVLQFDNDGIRRVFSVSGTSLFDFTTSTTAPLSIVGTTRASRVLSTGTLHVVNNLTGVTCDYSPTNVAWISSCNCPTSGSWAGTCSNGVNTTLVLSGCGTATLTIGPESTDLTFDRCGS
jgi:hypothetical protein